MYLTLSFGLCILSIAACISLYPFFFCFISSYFLFRVGGDLCGQNALVITLTLIMGIMYDLTSVYQS